MILPQGCIYCIMQGLSIARYKNISNAAEYLFISQPALSPPVRRLGEAECEPLCRKFRRISSTGLWANFVGRGNRNTGQNSYAPVVRAQIYIDAGFNNSFDTLVTFSDQHLETGVAFDTDTEGTMLEALREKRHSYSGLSFSAMGRVFIYLRI